VGDSCRKKAFGGGMPPGQRRTKSRSSNFKVEEKMPKAEGAKGGKCKKKRRRSLRHLRQEFRTGRSQGKLARTPDVTALPQSPSHHQVTKRRGGLIQEESLRPGRRHAPQGRGTHKAIRRHTKSFHISIMVLGEEGSSLLLYSLFPNTFRGGLDFQSLSFITHSHKKTRLQEYL
jgi:hypothetical protein